MGFHVMNTSTASFADDALIHTAGDDYALQQTRCNPLAPFCSHAAEDKDVVRAQDDGM